MALCVWEVVRAGWSTPVERKPTAGHLLGGLRDSWVSSMKLPNSLMP